MSPGAFCHVTHTRYNIREDKRTRGPLETTNGGQGHRLAKPDRRGRRKAAGVVGSFANQQS